MRNKLLLLSIVLGLFMLIPVKQVHAGWVLTGKFIDQEGNTILQRYFIQDNWVKFEQYNIIYTLNFETGQLIIVDPLKLLYYKGTLPEYVEGLKVLKQNQLDKLLAEIPVAQREETRQLYSVKISEIGQPVQVIKDTVRISPMEDSLRILGQPSEKYLVFLDSRKVEETWISPGLNINSKFSWEKYLNFLSVMEPENITLNYMISAPYQQLLERGYPSRRIIVASGFRVEYQLNKLEEKEIPAYEFYTPDQCKQLTLDKWLDRDEKKEVLYDDYE